MHDPLDTLRLVRTFPSATVRELADATGRSVDELQLDLDRLNHDGLLDYERVPGGSLAWTINVAGAQRLLEQDAAAGLAMERLEL